MSKNAKLLVFLTLLALLIVMYLVFSTKSITVKEKKDMNQEQSGSQAGTPVEAVDLSALETDYKSKTKGILNEFEIAASLWKESPDDAADEVAAKTATSSEPDILSGLSNKISKLRGQLMDITVPTQFRDLHMNLVMAFNKMEICLANRQIGEKDASLQLISQAKTKYDWLN